MHARNLLNLLCPAVLFHLHIIGGYSSPCRPRPLNSNSETSSHCLKKISSTSSAWLVSLAENHNVNHFGLLSNPYSYLNKLLNYKSMKSHVCNFRIGKCYKLHWRSQICFSYFICLSSFAVLVSKYWAWRIQMCDFCQTGGATWTKKILMNPDICSNRNWIVSLLKFL